MSNTTDTKRPYIQWAKIQTVLKILKKKKKKNSKRLHIRDDGVFGFWNFFFFSLKLRDDGDGPFLCEKVSCIIRSVGLDGHTLRDVDVDG